MDGIGSPSAAMKQADAVPWTSEAVISKRTNALSTKEPQEYEFPEIWAERSDIARSQGLGVSQRGSYGIPRGPIVA